MLFLSPIHAAAATIENVCFANVWESCSIVVDGTITAETVADFATKQSQMDGGSVMLNSDGGDAAAAIALGELIRERGLSTFVGTKGFGEPGSGVCQNACLFAYAGGEARYLASGSRLSFSGPDTFAAASNEAVKDVVRATALLMAQSIDPAVLLREDASDPFSDQELEQFNLVYIPARAFSALVLEPYNGGLVAFSERQDTPYPYDRATHLTAYCRSDTDIRFLLTATGEFMSDRGSAEIKVWNQMPVDQPAVETSIVIDEVATWTNDGRGFVEFTLDRDALPDIATLTAIDVSYHLSRADGSRVWARIDLVGMDRRMIGSVLENCIS
ncbi:hypothetical protein [Cognatiyoonia sp. IB215182]|uniref:hypothetical protein n=1 Tax=Cognatiyoonia sp. IB215182 TaxID=3097353 RepID=UPI002A0F551D|nr:hypothetical protein [Cognatiyoonia sp. IB215182]MDX8352611.1 hypothetical protein [Cognatiyoonia sp. IB215182]